MKLQSLIVIFIILIMVLPVVAQPRYQTSRYDSTNMKEQRYQAGGVIMGAGEDGLWHILRTDSYGNLFSTTAPFNYIYSDTVTATTCAGGTDSTLSFSAQTVDFVSVAAKESYGIFLGLTSSSTAMYVPPGCTFTWWGTSMDTIWVKTEEASSLVSAIAGKY